MCHTDPRDPDYGKRDDGKEDGHDATTTAEDAKPSYDMPNWKTPTPAADC